MLSLFNAISSVSLSLSLSLSLDGRTKEFRRDGKRPEQEYIYITFNQEKEIEDDEASNR